MRRVRRALLVLALLCAGLVAIMNSGADARWTCVDRPNHPRCQPAPTTTSSTPTTTSSTTTSTSTSTTTSTTTTSTTTTRPVGTLSLRVSGNRLIDGNGAPITLRGVNYSGAEYACIQGWGIFDGPSDDAMIDALASWHVKTVAIGLNEDCWLGINGVPTAYGGANYRNAIVAFVNRLHAHGMYAEIRLMWTAPGTTKATWQREAPDADHSPATWSSMAATFANDPAVILTPYGEPVVDWQCWMQTPCTINSGGQTMTTATAKQAVTAMRSNGYHGPIALACIQWANDCDGWLQYHPTDPDGQLVAAPHIYGNNTCGAQNNGACLTNTIAPIAASYPVLFGETGETYDDSECTDANMRVIIPWAESHNVSWQAWTWDTWGTCLALISDFNGTINTSGLLGATYATYIHDQLVSH